MRAFYLLFLLLFYGGFNFLQAQETAYAKGDLTNFSQEMCTCLEAQFAENSELQHFLYNGYNNCSMQYLTEHPKVLEGWLLLHYDGQLPTGADPQQLVVEEAGVALLRQGNPVLIRSCDLYREQLQSFKRIFFQQLVGVDPSVTTIDVAIKELEAAVPDIPQEENLVMVYNLLGVLNEFKGELDQARMYYQRSVDVGKGQSYLAAMFLSALEE